MKQVVYVASPDSQQIHVWQLGSTGELTLLQTVEVPGQVQPMTINRTSVICMLAFALILASSAITLPMMAP